MDHRELENLGERIEEIVDSAISSHNYQKLNQSITQAVESAVDSGSEALRQAMRGVLDTDAYKRYRYTPPESLHKKKAAPTPQLPALYEQKNGERIKGTLLTVGGGILTVGNGIGFLVTSIAAIATQTIGMVAAPITLGILTAAGVGLMKLGGSMSGRAKRYGKYVRALGEKTYINLEQLAKLAGKPVSFVRKDVRQMIDRGWFVQGHLDAKETCLITSDETYQHYEESERQLEKRRREEEKSPKLSREVQEILDKGQEYLTNIHECNDRIPGEEISHKIAHMEELVHRIFDRTREHPEVAPDLQKLMNFYLPMTIKLLHVYEELDKQPIQGENIAKSRQEIEETMDTLNLAFEKLLDSIFEETALDVSSDISVLHALLAQEGLTEEDEIQKVSKKNTKS